MCLVGFSISICHAMPQRSRSFNVAVSLKLDLALQDDVFVGVANR